MLSYERPADCEFSPQTIKDALWRAGYKCERCDRTKPEIRDHYFEIHHKLGIAHALAYYPNLSHAIIRSLANAEVLCKDCHQEATNEMNYVYQTMAAGLIGSLHQMAFA
jgi:5-methylcytosine-specific restriction endonuclease McrA